MKEKIKVFLCDDHTLFREGVKAIFRNHPEMEIVGEAQNGREAIARIKKVHPDVVLMDISMPVMNGVEATRVITHSMKNVKVVMLTMYDDEDLIQGCMDAGASGYILKDALSDQLIRAVSEAFKGRRNQGPGSARKVVEEILQARKQRESRRRVA